MLILDPVIAFLAKRINWHVDQSVRRLLLPLAELAERSAVAAVGVRHLSKETKRKAIYRGSGSIGILGASRSGLLAAQDPDDPQRRLLVTLKANLAAAGSAYEYELVAAGDSVRVIWQRRRQADPAALLRRPPNREEAVAFLEAVDFLKGLLADGPVLATEVLEHARSLGIKDVTLRRAKLRLGVVSRHEADRFGGGRWLWELREEDAGEGACRSA